ncbi:uncharacterized protein LOC143240899 [Tachypleus tridentatus]|uniref:uncharacterized protein LOC143240899 n=1 Tax=Tachypleus tridentatus TaxID=6853 RepID=UPI003FD536D6
MKIINQKGRAQVQVSVFITVFSFWWTISSSLTTQTTTFLSRLDYPTTSTLVNSTLYQAVWKYFNGFPNKFEGKIKAIKPHSELDVQHNSTVEYLNMESQDFKEIVPEVTFDLRNEYYVNTSMMKQQDSKNNINSSESRVKISYSLEYNTKVPEILINSENSKEIPYGLECNTTERVKITRENTTVVQEISINSTFAPENSSVIPESKNIIPQISKGKLTTFGEVSGRNRTISESRNNPMFSTHDSQMSLFHENTSKTVDDSEAILMLTEIRQNKTWTLNKLKGNRTISEIMFFESDTTENNTVFSNVTENKIIILSRENRNSTLDTGMNIKISDNERTSESYWYEPVNNYSTPIEYAVSKLLNSSANFRHLNNDVKQSAAEGKVSIPENSTDVSTRGPGTNVSLLTQDGKHLDRDVVVTFQLVYPEDTFNKPSTHSTTINETSKFNNTTSWPCISVFEPHQITCEFIFTMRVSRFTREILVEDFKKKLSGFLNQTKCMTIVVTSFELGSYCKLSWSDLSINHSYCDWYTINQVWNNLVQNKEPRLDLVQHFEDEFQIFHIEQKLKGFCDQREALGSPAQIAIVIIVIILIFIVVTWVARRKISRDPNSEEMLGKRYPIILFGEVRRSLRGQTVFKEHSTLKLANSVFYDNKVFQGFPLTGCCPPAYSPKIDDGDSGNSSSSDTREGSTPNPERDRDAKLAKNTVSCDDDVLVTVENTYLSLSA